MIYLLQVKAWPGRKFTFVMEAIEEYDNPTTTLARLRFIPYQETKVCSNADDIVFENLFKLQSCHINNLTVLPGLYMLNKRRQLP